MKGQNNLEEKLNVLENVKNEARKEKKVLKVFPASRKKVEKSDMLNTCTYAPRGGLEAYRRGVTMTYIWGLKMGKNFKTFWRVSTHYHINGERFWAASTYFLINA